MEPENGPDETASAQSAPVSRHLQPVTRRLEALDDECRLSGRDIRDDPSHVPVPG
jgi:hypothetical protein